MRPRAVLAWVLFVGVAAAATPWTTLAIPFRDRSALRSEKERAADRAWWPDYPAFLADVRAATRRGDTIALVVPGMNWEYGYSYAFFRATYLLEGRQVIPLVGPNNRRLTENVRRANYIAAWRMRPARSWRPLLARHGGTLLVR